MERAGAPYAPAGERAPGRRWGGGGGVSSSVEGSWGRGGENNAKGKGMGTSGDAKAPASELPLAREARGQCKRRGQQGRKQIGLGT